MSLCLLDSIAFSLGSDASVQRWQGTRGGGGAFFSLLGFFS